MSPNDRYHPPPHDDECGDLLNALLNESQPASVRTAELQEAIAAAALTAPVRRAPAGCLTNIRRQIAATTTGLNGHATPAAERKVIAFRGSRLGWGLAAALALFGGWQTVRVFQLNDQLAAAEKARGAAESGATGDGNDVSTHPAGNAPDKALASDRPGIRRNPFTSRNGAEAILVPDRPALERKLAELQRAQEARLQQSPGMARTVVTELNPPGKSGTSSRTPALADEVAEIIAAGMTRTRSGKPFTLSSTDRARPGGGMTFEEGLPNLSGLTLPPDTAFLHNHFPTDTWQDWEGLHLLKDGSFYDELNNLLWKPVTGGRYSGSVPEEPIILEDRAAPRDTPGTSSTQSSTGGDAQPLIWSIYDESRGEGRLVISDLPAAPEGKSYQLWFEDANTSAPVTAGLLPPLEGGEGQVWFNLTPGISPTRYRITLEPSGGSTQPTGTSILSGP